uniref:Uncharacterized protein n=1 Tax=Rhizophora mucronata TaxID=61149 RepID=A0A2P2QDD4_RHIMU
MPTKHMKLHHCHSTNQSCHMYSHLEFGIGVQLIISPTHSFKSLVCVCVCLKKKEILFHKNQ